MRWAVEIQKTSLEPRMLGALLQRLGYRLEPGHGTAVHSFWSPAWESLMTSAEVWEDAKKVRSLFRGPTRADIDFQLGAVIDSSDRSSAGRHVFLEPKSTIHVQATVSVTGIGTVSPPPNLSTDQRRRWEAEQAERVYQHNLERLLEILEPAWLEPKAAKVLELLEIPNHNGTTIWKIYELMRGHRSKCKEFRTAFGVDQHEFDRFNDAVHKPSVSGDLARHADDGPPRTANPMNMREAEAFIRTLAKAWLADIRESKGRKTLP